MNQQKLPNATATLILGILSIPTCCFFSGIISLIIGGIGIYLANKDAKMYKENPSGYDNYGNVQAGKILSIIGICLGVITLLITIGFGLFIGFDNMDNKELILEKMKELIGK